MPALKHYGLSPEGDALIAAGNTDAAADALREAATVNTNPSVSMRMVYLEKGGGAGARGGADRTVIR